MHQKKIVSDSVAPMPWSHGDFIFRFASTSILGKEMSFFLLVQDKKSSGLKAEREKNHDHHPVSVDQVCKSGVHATCPCKDLGHQPAVKLQG
ncbi:hypothetical protein ACOMHN_025042 [Nucella lapillus]